MRADKFRCSDWFFVEGNGGIRFSFKKYNLVSEYKKYNLVSIQKRMETKRMKSTLINIFVRLKYIYFKMYIFIYKSR